MGDARWMQVAVDQARAGLGTTAPNPSVGAVLVKGGEILATGYTQPVGGPHAEIVALQRAASAGVDVRGATLYATLEPCCHFGRTPPCTDAIVRAGIARVVVGTVDPYPPMRGKGNRALREAGIDVTLGVLAAECRALIRGFARANLSGLPEVTAKVAMSLDGHIATAAGESRWITGEASRALGHELRATHDAIVVGIGTVLADDPRLTCRTHEGRDPVPVILDSRLRVPDDAAVLHGPRRAQVFCAPDAPLRDLPADVHRVGRAGDGLDVEAVLRVLADHGLHRVLVEGGGAVHRAFFDARLVDELHLFVAGLLLPGGRSWLGGPPIAALADALRFGEPVVSHADQDVVLRYAIPHRLGEPVATDETAAPRDAG